MPDPYFPSQTTRFGLPLLFVGQAQKEVTVNELAARLDALLSCSVEGVRDDPPISLTEGQCWIVGPAASGEWAGQSDSIAQRLGGAWQFLAPPEGMMVFDKLRGAIRRFAGGWQTPQRPTAPTGGTTVDLEARAGLAAIVAVLQTAGMIPEN